MQDSEKKQNSIVCNDPILSEEWTKRQEQLVEAITENYQWALQNGIAKEQSRCILPEGMTISKLYMNGSVRSWIHYLKVRMSWDTQKEHRDVALACYGEIRKIFPLIEKVLE